MACAAPGLQLTGGCRSTLSAHTLMPRCAACCLLSCAVLQAGSTSAAAPGAAAAATAAAAVVAPLQLTDLPNDAVTQCSRPEVRRAFVQCIAGPSADCCRGLDEVFADSSSPSAW
jgi:hypothetical protein